MKEIGHCISHLFLSLSSLLCGLTTTSFFSMLTLNKRALELSWYSCPISIVFWNVALRWSVCLAYSRCKGQWTCLGVCYLIVGVNSSLNRTIHNQFGEFLFKTRNCGVESFSHKVEIHRSERTKVLHQSLVSDLLVQNINVLVQECVQQQTVLQM